MPEFKDIPQLTQARYRVNMSWDYIFEWLEKYNCDLTPDFQRDYVWTGKQKTDYIEWILRGGLTGKDIYLNHPNWMRSFEGNLIIIDGKQRLNDVKEFLSNKLKAYGYYFNEYEDKLSYWRYDFLVNVADLKTRKEILTWYLQLNTGGTVHTEDEIEKVKELIKKEE